MAKFFEIKGKTATQNAHMAYTAYNRAQAMATEQNAKIDFVDGKKIKATFTSNAKAKSFVTAFESEYAEASKAYQAQKTSSSKPTQAKGKTSSTKKTETKKATPKKSTTSPKKAKGNSKSKLENFVLNNPSCTRAEAVAHGFSGTKSELALYKKSRGVR